jgi:hypothetical protein
MVGQDYKRDERAAKEGTPNWPRTGFACLKVQAKVTMPLLVYHHFRVDEACRASSPPTIVYSLHDAFHGAHLIIGVPRTNAPSSMMSLVLQQQTTIRNYSFMPSHFSAMTAYSWLARWHGALRKTADVRMAVRKPTFGILLVEDQQRYEQCLLQERWTLRPFDCEGRSRI